MLASQQHYLEKLAIELFKNGYSEDVVRDVLTREKQKFEKQGNSYLITQSKLENARYDYWTFLECMKAGSEDHSFLELTQDWEKVVVGGFQEITTSSDIDRGIFNLTPRLGKTTLITELGGAFWLGREKFKLAVVNANFDKVNEINSKIKQIVNTEIYQEIFKVKDNAPKNATRKIALSNGSMSNFKVSGSNVIGSGYNGIIFDDFLNPNNERSLARKEQAKMNLSSFLSRKEYRKQSDGTFQGTKIIVVEQRVSIDDTTAICKSKWDEFNILYKHISLPFYFKEDTKIGTFEFKQDTYIDKRFNDKVKNEIIAERGLTTFETQYQQNPIDSQDILIKNEWWRHYTCEPLDLDLKNIFITCDLALTEKTTSDYSVICAWGVDSENKLYLLDGMRTKARYNEIKQVFISFYQKWSYNKYANRNYIKASQFFIEDVSVSKPLIDDLRNVISIIKPIPRNTSKTARMEASSTTIANGFVFLPKNLPFAQELVDEAYHFRADNSHRHDDIVDNLCDAIEHGLSRATKNTDFTKINSALSRYYNT